MPKANSVFTYRGGFLNYRNNFIRGALTMNIDIKILFVSKAFANPYCAFVQIIKSHLSPLPKKMQTCGCRGRLSAGCFYQVNQVLRGTQLLCQTVQPHTEQLQKPWRDHLIPKRVCENICKPKLEICLYFKYLIHFKNSIIDKF